MIGPGTGSPGTDLDGDAQGPGPGRKAAQLARSAVRKAVPDPVPERPRTPTAGQYAPPRTNHRALRSTPTAGQYAPRIDHRAVTPPGTDHRHLRGPSGRHRTRHVPRSVSSRPKAVMIRKTAC
ncbi:hypothetical protein GCM10010387_08080 [Streptomyces inusitatus]|uniref:Uncharacterized protein n=1 Tax=Streptomyces inusitatus TaxID=68221 RepID=A0A918PPG0_9ACTN|nr:hypothetical protein GCM10010387_08080 [Streptomyces inusitatus]